MTFVFRTFSASIVFYSLPPRAKELSLLRSLFKEKRMPKVEIEKDRCKACELCVSFCNKECLAIGEDMNSAGYFAVEFVNAEECTGCGLCAEMCPDMAIEVWK